jgi:hypothetical protein
VLPFGICFCFDSIINRFKTVIDFDTKLDFPQTIRRQYGDKCLGQSCQDTLCLNFYLIFLWSVELFLKMTKYLIGTS